MSITVFGIRHHGPGCARSLLDALHTLEPDILLVEGPPDAQEALSLLRHDGMRPPVALLVYVPDRPSQSAFYPFATYSPEWQSLLYATDNNIPARFIDLPCALRFGREAAPKPAPNGNGVTMQDDPIGLLAQAAGYTDHELWWEHQIEQRRNATDLFAGIMEAMAAIRDDAPAPAGEEALREAHMRQAIRAARKEGFQRIAVVCGAWHAPVLADPGPATADTRLLAGLKREKVAATWVPWTNSRLSSRSGYGAGVWSPGWYEHLWSAPDRHAIRWVSRAASLLRDEDLVAPSSNVIEAVRLADALAALRGLPMPGLAELHEAMQTTFCGGDPAPMQLIRNRLEIGEALGSVPEATPTMPLQADLTAQQRRLRLKLSAEQVSLDLDLRNDTDLARSRLLHALRLLGIEWGQPVRASGGKGTFHEHWTIVWRPELSVAVIEASRWGNTVVTAATARIRDAAAQTLELPQLTAMLDGAILADLPEAVNDLLQRVREGAAVAADVRQMMNALLPLARVARYGDVRGTDREQVIPVIDALFQRAIVGLPGACQSLDDAAAEEMVTSIGQAHEALVLLDQADQRTDWRKALRALVDREASHGLVRGWCCRLLLEERAIDAQEAQRLARLALSPVVPVETAASWVSGVTRGSGLLLLQQPGIWSALDAWLADLPPDTFVETLPLLRRAFSAFQPPERRAMGDLVKRLRSSDRGESPANEGTTLMDQIDRDRADRVLPILAQILGVELERSGEH